MADQFLIMNSNIRMFGRALHTLARVGEELFLESDGCHLSLRSINLSKSAFASISFESAFFVKFAQHTIRCKVPLKPCVHALRSFHSIDKVVHECFLNVEAKNCRLAILLNCKHSIRKRHYVPFIECETANTKYSMAGMKVRLQAESKFLNDVLSNFQSQQEEITLRFDNSRMKIQLCTYNENSTDKSVHTSLILSSSQFVHAAYDTSSVSSAAPTEDVAEVTFCLRELKAFLYFVDPVNPLVTIGFDSPGKPIVFEAHNDGAFTLSFVLATLAVKSDFNGLSQVSTIHPSARLTENSTCEQVSMRSVNEMTSVAPCEPSCDPVETSEWASDPIESRDTQVVAAPTLNQLFPRCFNLTQTQPTCTVLADDSDLDDA